MIEKVKGLTASQIKWIALFFMTVDHSYVLCENTPILAQFIPIIRILGRIAAPLFLFIITESARYTSSKKGFLTRLYVAGVCTGIFTILTNIIFGNFIIYTPGNIIFTFFYTVTYIYLVKNIAHAISNRDLKLLVKSIAMGFLTVLPQVLFNWFDNLQLHSLERDTVILLREIITTIFPPILHVEYSILFIALGVFLYFCESLKQKCCVFILFCCLSLAGSLTGSDLYPVNEFMLDGQYWMILAVPFMFLYNGKRGKSEAKMFFYIYYPVHRYLLVLLGKLVSICG